MTTKGTELPDTIQAIEYFFEQGLTDGLPVVPPTAEAVQAFLEAGGLAPDEVLGTRESRNWIVTAQKVAVNAIMAGCKAEYAPVVAAAVRAMLKPEFNLSGISETTSGMSAPMIVVNGPIRKKLDINSGWNLFGPGWRANSTIGRTLRLILMNVCGEIPGVTDKSAFGSPARYTCCIAEDEESSIWEPYHVEKGFDPSSSTVSLFPALPPIPVFNYADNSPKAILDTISHAIAANINCHGELVLIISGEHLFNIEPAGMTKAEIKEYIAERVNEMSPGLVFDAERAYELGGVTPFEDPVSEERSVPTLPEQLHLYVAGGTGGAVSAMVPIFSHGHSSTSVIEPIVEP